MKVVFIGAGNLATRLSTRMQQAGIPVVQVYSHTPANAEKLAIRLGCTFAVLPEEIVPDADLYIFSLKDTVLPEIISRVSPNGALWVHTAGSIPLDVFKGRASRYGVLYPLQTFSKEREVDFRNIPFFVEAADERDSLLLQQIASKLSAQVHILSSEKRKILHLAAVFACNFANHMYVQAANLLKEHELPFDWLLPLIDETAAKVHALPPVKAQTGPAVRYDENVMQKQIGLLPSEEMKELYKVISKNIHKEALENEQHKL